MALVDTFLMQHVSGGLEPGEAVMGMGLLRRQRSTSGGQHVVWDDYLAVATDRRLIVFETETGGVFTPTARPIAHDPVEWRYEDLSRVGVKPIFGVTSGVSLFVGCHPFLGPYASTQRAEDAEGVGRRYDVFATCDGLDGQRAFHAQFPTWLDQRVAAGAFPLSPQKRAWVESRIAARRAEVAAEQQRVLQRAEARDAKIRAAWAQTKVVLRNNRGALAYVIPVVLLIAGLGCAVFGGALMFESYEDYEEAGDELEVDEAKVKMLRSDLATWVPRRDLLPPNDCPEQKWARKRFDSSPPRRSCHLCEIGRGNERSYQRDGETWSCPGPEVYQAALAKASKDVDAAERTQEREVSTSILGAVVSGSSLLATPALLLLNRFLWRRTRRKADVAAATSKGPGAMVGAG